MTTPTGAPPWRLLAALTALVALAHMQVLQSSPARLGTQLNADAALAKSFSTRSIEAKPAPQAVAVAPAAAVRPKPAAAPAPDQSSSPAPASIAAEQSIMGWPAATEFGPKGPGLAASTVPATPVQAELTASPSPAAAASAVAATLPAGPQTTPVTAVALPGSTLLQYKVTGTSKGLTYNANSELAWNNTGTAYELSMKVSAFLLGARSMSSAGQITPGGLAPTRFSDKSRSEMAAHFQADKGKITFSANTPDAPWIEGAQDRVSVFVQLGGMLAGKPGDFPVGSSITLYTVGPREADSWTFTVEAEETLKLRGDDVATLRLTRKPRREYDQKVEIWYAPSLGYLPVRNRITQQNGDFIDQQLTHIGARL